MDELKEQIRAYTRPVLLVLLLVGSWYIIANGISGALANSWVGFTISALGEWILERPALKAWEAWKAWKTGKSRKRGR